MQIKIHKYVHRVEKAGEKFPNKSHCPDSTTPPPPPNYSIVDLNDSLRVAASEWVKSASKLLGVQ